MDSGAADLVKKEEEVEGCLICGKPSHQRRLEKECDKWQGPCFYGWGCVAGRLYKMLQKDNL